MAKKHTAAPAAPVPEVDPVDPIDDPPEQAGPPAQTPPPDAGDELEGTRPPAPRMPQGIEFRFMSSGDPRKDLHPRHRHVRMIDPDCLVVDGQDPWLALPIEGNPENVRIRQVGARAAAELLTCDPATGAASVHRLATDAETKKAKDELAARQGR